MNVDSISNNVDEKNKNLNLDIDEDEDDDFNDSLNQIEIIKLNRDKILEDNFKKKMLRREFSNISNMKNSKSAQNIISSNQNVISTNIKPIENIEPTVPSPNFTTNYRQSVINNFNSWLSEISSGALFQNFILSNPFRRRVSRTPTITPNVLLSDSKLIDEVDYVKETDSATSGLDSDAFKMLIGTIKPTLKGNELIELANFGVIEIDGEEPGLGHKFKFFPLSSHTFCDNCSEFIWTPVIHHSNTISVNIMSPYSQTVKCINCKYTCHYRCSKFVRVNCQKSIENNLIEHKSINQQDDDNLDKEPESLFEEINILERKINKYNQRIAHKGSGLGMYLLEDKKNFKGFLRVHLNLTRPINVIAGTRPPSIYDIMNDEETSSRRTLTTFYMPRGTVKNIHINSKNSSIDVIKAMLKKFKMVDNHQKFALYKKFLDENQKTILSRVGDFEYPLKIALDWLDSDEKQFVLQENDTADVNWNEFQLPELKNFLQILDREEKEHLVQVKNKYESLKRELEKMINYKNIFSDAIYI